ncbi:MAG: FAD-dependent oxidoreductase, partial [Alphaproteobacteria bacterium]|nr:FAD-dependent oxidoreductase [Alphaproteobacteria bacterium]
MVQVSRRWLLRAILLGLAGFAAFVARPVYHLGRVAWRDLDRRQPGPQGSLDDASRMSPTPVAKYIEVADETALAAALQEARTMGWGVAIAGARQSMGGQALVRDGMVLDLKAMDVMNYDEDGKVLTVGAGARWGDVVRFLDDKGRSVVIMPPYEDFSVGGSLATNSHGAITGQAPIAPSGRRPSGRPARGGIGRCGRRARAAVCARVRGRYGLAGGVLCP